MRLRRYLAPILDAILCLIVLAAATMIAGGFAVSDHGGRAIITVLIAAVFIARLAPIGRLP